MDSFILEGRIISASLISKNPVRGFYPAGQTELLAPSNVQTEKTLHEYRPTETQTPVTPTFLIMAEISSENAMPFLHLIQKLGTAQRIGDTLWALNGQIDLQTLKNQLSSALDRRDRLFILDCLNNKTEWHNIGADLGDRLKTMWPEG